MQPQGFLAMATQPQQVQLLRPPALSLCQLQRQGQQLNLPRSPPCTLSLLPSCQWRQKAILGVGLSPAPRSLVVPFLPASLSLMRSERQLLPYGLRILPLHAHSGTDAADDDLTLSRGPGAPSKSPRLSEFYNRCKGWVETLLRTLGHFQKRWQQSNIGAQVFTGAVLLLAVLLGRRATTTQSWGSCGSWDVAQVAQKDQQSMRNASPARGISRGHVSDCAPGAQSGATTGAVVSSAGTLVAGMERNCEAQRWLNVVVDSSPAPATVTAADRGDQNAIRDIKESGAHETSQEGLALNAWLEGLRQEAIQKGLSEATVELALEGIKPLPAVMKKDQMQPEVILSTEQYVKKMVNAFAIKRGVEEYRAHYGTLADVQSHYGVPASIVTAIWGIESSFGRNSGSFDVVQALLTLAFRSTQLPRASYFRKELIEAMRIMQNAQGPKGEERLKGSWAGAMGQCQFMPSSFQAHAVDFDGDGVPDVWTSFADVVASISNYLVKHGWQPDRPICLKVTVSRKLNQKLLGLGVTLTTHEWITKHGVHVVEGLPASSPALPSSLVAPDGLGGQVYLVFDNFRTILKYNKALSYAFSVNELARCISSEVAGGRKEKG